MIAPDPSRFRVLKNAVINGSQYRISSVRSDCNGAVYVKFDGIDDRNAAESLRGAVIEIEKSEAPPLDAGEFYVSDVVGARISARYGDEVRELGIITRVDAFGAADVFSAENGGNKFSFPFLKALNAQFDEQMRVLTVDGKKFDEVAVYED